MARKAEVIITCDATTVKQIMAGLNREMEKTKQRRQELQAQQRTSVGLTKAEEKELQELIKYENALNDKQQKLTGETKKLNQVMQDLAGSKLKDLKRALSEGKNALNKMSEKSPGREKLVDDLKRIQMQIDKNTGATNKLNAANKGLSNTLATTAKNLATYMIGFAGFNKIKSLVEGVFQANLKLSDSLANIRKVSGLSTEAINDMYRQIAKIDTRNTIETLNQLAYTGAKLGIGQQYGVSGLVGFVKAAEQVQMALGEDMGEKALPDLAKMVEVMGLIPKYGVEQSMQKAASAIFQLGATSTATGTNIVEFSKRLYGLANVSRISTQDLLGLASASDAMGLMPEVSATAFNKLFTSIQRQHNLSEKSLGMAKGRIKELYDEGKTMDAIVEIFERMNEKGNLNLLGNIFKDLGSDGARLVNVMATMADRADMLRKHLNVSRDAFKEGEAVIGEYMIQNQTAAALVERAANLWAKAFTNPEGVDMVKEMAQAWYDLSKQMTQSEALMKSLHTSIEWIATAIGTLIKLFPVLIRFGMIFGASLGIKGLIAGLGGLVTAFRTLYKDIALATGAMGTFNVVMKSNAVLFAISAIATAITLVNDYSKAAEEAAKREAERQAKLKAAFSESKEAVENVVKPLERYKRILEEGNLSENQKLQVIKELNQTYQEYLDYLGIEIKSADDLAKAYARVVDIMKIKKAYEERESFRQQKNGENRMSRIEGQAKVEAAARSFGVTDINKDWLEQTQNVKGKGTITMRGSADVYREIIEKKMGVKSFQQSGDEITFLEIDGKLVAPGTTSAPRAKRRYRKVSSKELYDVLADYITSYRTERTTNKEIDAMFDSEYSWTDKNGKKRKLSEFNIDEYNDAVQKAKYKRKGSLENEKPDKAAAAAAKKAQQDRKKALKLEMDEAQKASTGIISKLEEFYRLQEAAIQEARADGQLTEDQAKEMVRALSIVKNESLATARRAVTSGETAEWDELKTKVLPAIMSDTSEVSRSLLETIQQVAVDKLHDDLKKFNGSVSVEGLDSRAFFDQMRAKAAGNTREAARLRAKIRNEVDKALLQYQFVDQATEKMRKDLETMGFVTETYEQFAARMQAGIKEKPDTNIGVSESKRSELLAAFKAYGEQTQGPKNAEGEYSQDDADIVRWVQAWSQEGNAEWMKGLPHIDEWLKDAETYKQQIADFYRALLQMYEGYKKQTMRSDDISRDDFAAREGRKQVEQGKSQLDQMVSSTISDEQAYRQMGNKFIQQGIINFSYNIDNEEEARQWVHQFATDAKGDIEGWAKAFPELVAWIDLIKRKEQGETLGEIEEQALKDAMPGIRNLFNELLNHSDRVNKAIKQAYEHEKEQQDMRFQVAGYRKQEEETDSAWESVGKQKDAGIGQSLAEQIGVDKIADDPEIQRIQNRIYWRNKELEEAKAIFKQRQEQNELELQALLQYQFVDQSTEKMRKDLETMGFVTETYEQFAARMQAGIKEKPDTNIGVSESKRSELLAAFKAYGEQTQGPKNAEGEYSQDDADIVRWVQAWSQEGNAEWMKGLPHIDEWLKDAETYKQQIADFYRALLQMYEGYKKQTMRSDDISRDDFAAREGRKQVEQGKSQLDQMVSSTISDEQAYRQMGNKFIQQGIINFSYNIDNEEEARQWVHQFATDAKGDIEGWAKAFPELVAWIDLIKRKEQGETLGEIEEQALKDAMPGIRNLFNELLNHSDRVNKAIKQAYEHEKEQQDMRFQVAGYRKQEEETDSAWESVGKQKDAGIGQSLAEQIGVDKIADDPEIQRIQNRIYWRNKELEEAKAIFKQRQEQNELELQALRDRNATEQEIEALRLQQKQDNAGIEELIKARQTELFNETSNLATQVSQQLQKRVNAIQSLVKPITDFTQAAGRKIGDMIFNMESEEATWEELWKNMALAVGESVIQMGAQYAQNLLMQQAMNRASEAETVADAGVKVSAGIAAGSAKTIGELGWWGIPLIAVISSVLMGLLQSALSTKSNKDGSSSSSSTSSSAIKTKLVSGMLTYDRGNVEKFAGRRKLYDDGTTQVYGGRHQYQGDGGQHQYQGTDGQSYRATAVAAPADGLVTQPIATTVQGQPALVAERGPEIVIGRRTTRAIMMNEPGLIRYLANYSKSSGASAGPRYRTLDEGNIDTMQLPDGGGNTVGTDPELRNTLAALTQVVGSLQQQLDKGIKSTINMYGSDGLYENMNKANKFMGRYGG